MDDEQFDLEAIKSAASLKNRYEKQLDAMISKGLQSEFVKEAVEGSLKNLAGGGKTAFVIYGDPQSGKTEMMICLTAKLLDDGNKVIVHLMNDSVDLLAQNLDRFSTSGLSPAPINSVEAIKKGIFDQETIIFCKKNGRNLAALLEAIDDARKKGQSVDSVVVIDDEADFASPNSRINSGTKTPINDYIDTLIGKSGIYIGVTATPARLNLNHTFDNKPEHWVRFPAHTYYTGQDTFFPQNLEAPVDFRRIWLANGGSETEARSAIIRFCVTVAHLNQGDASDNYSMLFHTSGKKAQHEVDTATIEKLIQDLRGHAGPVFEALAKEAFDAAKQLYPADSANALAAYVIGNISKSRLFVLNSTRDRNALTGSATKPSSPFTFYVGGNIVSRGVTFDNLLSMFFTRNVANKLQQDTYIQRARMFGARNKYLKHFELSIPQALYNDWQRCFVFHRLSLRSIENKLQAPAWVGDKRIAVAAPSSIDQTTVQVDKGEMSFAMFAWDPQLDDIAAAAPHSITSLTAMQQIVGEEGLPSYLIEFLQQYDDQGKLAIHTSYQLQRYQGEVMDKIERRQGFLGNNQLEPVKFPDGIHHVRIIRNSSAKARVFFKIKDSTFTKQAV
ncbi:MULTISPECIES: Z1 domain-containing protein [unclassified Mesorhizobium]|uniref:Z1 domain-containing protein n=1 Tax=unclassified Mesorhizobium TaxID=325217 RepID=UPI00333B8EB5